MWLAIGLGFPTLTKQQERAMRSFLWRDGFDNETTDLTVWDYGVRPWPTMENLARKGFVQPVSYGGPEEGWLYRLTDLGRSYMESLTRARNR